MHDKDYTFRVGLLHHWLTISGQSSPYAKPYFSAAPLGMISRPVAIRRISAASRVCRSLPLYMQQVETIWSGLQLLKPPNVTDRIRLSPLADKVHDPPLPAPKARMTVLGST
jgi:hypothetical protein